MAWIDWNLSSNDLTLLHDHWFVFFGVVIHYPWKNEHNITYQIISHVQFIIKQHNNNLYRKQQSIYTFVDVFCSKPST